MSPLEKFKRRLVRDIARRQYVVGQPEEEMWDQLKTEYGCDCYLLWQHMSVLTTKKLKRLLAAEDRMECITQVARMTPTDWLTFDLVLVHQDVDVIGEELIQSGKPESPVLGHLFTLVTKYDVENVSSDNIVANWAALTHFYNTGGRACSPMLLQRRWYQMKDLTRRRFYDFWRSYRGNPRNLEKSVKPSKLQFQIADTFPNLITEKFVQWKDLVEIGKIVQAVQFESRNRKIESNMSKNDDDPDLVVIEPQVETIEVAADSDTEDDQVTVNVNVRTQSETNTAETKAENRITTVEVNTDKLKEGNISKTMEQLSPDVSIKVIPTEIVDEVSDTINKGNNLSISIKTEPTEVLEVNDILNDDPIEAYNMEQGAETFSQEHAENDSTLAETEIVLPKITSVMGNVDMLEPHDKSKSIVCLETNTDRELSEANCEDSRIEPNTAPSIISDDSIKTVEEKVEKELCYNTDVVIDLNELPPTLEFVDDGIELVDCDEDALQIADADEDDDKIESLEKDDPTCKIDRKLVMFPIMYTKKLDEMVTLRDIGYFTVKGNDVIELVEEESRPIRMKSIQKIEIKVKIENKQIGEERGEDDIKIKNENEEINEVRSPNDSKVEKKHEKMEEVGGENNSEVIVENEEIDEVESEDNSEECEVPRIKYTSWLLQKPKHRNYNPIQLCKNPDFNTRLKRLSVGFFLSERNRRLFNACKPLTIDMHKTFETKLVNNVLYLENTTIPIIKQEKLNDTCENTASVIPSTVAVQSLLDKTKEDENLLSQKFKVDVPKLSPEAGVIDRGEVINLPSMSSMSHANENLLTVEMRAITPRTTLSEDQPPMQLVEPLINMAQNHSCAKKIKKTKTKPSSALPHWTMYNSPQVTQDESLITRDTLNKVFTLLDTGLFPRAKKGQADQADAAKNRKVMKGKPPLSLKTISDRENVKNSDETVNLTVDDDEVISNEDCPIPKNETKNYVNNIPKKRRRRKCLQSIASASGFCCWARHRIDALRRENINNSNYKKYRHLCPMAFNVCFCCCRDGLIDTVESMTMQISDQTNTVDDNRPWTLKIRRDVLIQTQSVPDENGKIRILSTVEFYPPQYKIVPANEMQTALDTVRGVSTSIPLTNSVSCSFGSMQYENDNDDDRLDMQANNELSPSTCYKNVSSDTCNNGSTTTHVKAPPYIKTKIIPGRPYRKDSVEAVAEPATPPNTPSLKIKNNNNTKTIVETISLLDDETDSTTDESVQPPANTLLPQGVNLLLLPDNTLSVSIDPGVKIDPVSLSKLPDILAAVQKKLLESGVFDIQRQHQLINALNRNTEINIDTSENMVLNDTSIINLDPELNIIVNPEANVPKENAELNVITTEVNFIEEYAELNIANAELNVTQENSNLNIVNGEENAVLNVINTELNVTQEDAVPVTQENSEVNVVQEDAEINITQINAEPDDISSNLEINIAQRDPVLNVVSPNLEPKVTNTPENVRNDDSAVKLTYTDFVVKVAPETNRKTILSDLMTMSGISPEDANTPVEAPSNTIINYSLPDNPNYLTDIQNVGGNIQIIPPTKKLKKVMVFIKKRLKRKPLKNNSVIDLTEDKDKSDDDSEQNDPHTTKVPQQAVVCKKMANVKNTKLIRVPASAVPLKIYKAAQSLLKKDNTVQNNEKISDMDKKMKIHIARHYRQLNKKPTILDILNNIKNTKILNGNKQNARHADSDSSDDEPLAKKSKRMKTESNTNSNDSMDIVPIRQYDLPVEFNTDVHTMDTASIDKQNVNTSNHVEEYSILNI